MVFACKLQLQLRAKTSLTKALPIFCAMISSACKAILSISQSLVYHAWTAFLFTKSDIKTTLIPIVCLSST